MKILFIGLGSIGQRHLANAKKIFRKDSFFALRIKNQKVLIKNLKSKNKVDLEKYYKIKILKNYKSAIKLKPNLTFICNPSSKHLNDAIKFAKINSNLFIEKPLGRSRKLEKKLLKIVNKKKLITMVGYQSRYHPLVVKLKKMIDQKRYGKIIYGNFNFLTYLPNFHKYEDYKLSYAAQKKLGGGVIDGLIHEIDLISYFFGLPIKHNSFKNNSNVIKINSDETFNSLMRFKNNSNFFEVFLRLSYVQKKEERNISILFEKALIKLCFIRNEIKIYSNKNLIQKKVKVNISRNQIFFNQLKDFKKYLLAKKNPPTSIIKNKKTQQLFMSLIK